MRTPTNPVRLITETLHFSRKCFCNFLFRFENIFTLLCILCPYSTVVYLLRVFSTFLRDGRIICTRKNIGSRQRQDRIECSHIFTSPLNKSCHAKCCLVMVRNLTRRGMCISCLQAALSTCVRDMSLLLPHTNSGQMACFIVRSMVPSCSSLQSCSGVHFRDKTKQGVQVLVRTYVSTRSFDSSVQSTCIYVTNVSETPCTSRTWRCLTVS